MLGALMLGLSTIYTVVVVDLIVESAPSGAKKLTVFGNQFAEVTKWNGVYIVAALAATAALLLVTSLAYLRGRRLEKKMAADLDSRFNELSQRNATFEARNDLLSWRVEDLTEQLERLTARRDDTLRELDRLQHESERLASPIDEDQASSEREQLDRLLVLPESQPAQVVGTREAPVSGEAQAGGSEPPVPPAPVPGATTATDRAADDATDPNDPFA